MTSHGFSPNKLGVQMELAGGCFKLTSGVTTELKEGGGPLCWAQAIWSFIGQSQHLELHPRSYWNPGTEVRNNIIIIPGL